MISGFFVHIIKCAVLIRFFAHRKADFGLSWGADMPPVTFDGKSFSVGSRRFLIVGARFEYSLCPPEEWENRLLAVKQQGFNTVLISCPWFLHEPTQGVFDFEDSLDVARCIDIAEELGLKVVLRAGPVVGRPFDGAGLPNWLADHPEILIRERDPAFMDLVSRWYGALSKQIADKQADLETEGPVLAVQLEHEWTCGAIEDGRSYLDELIRLARERGLSVPVMTANNFWQDIDESIETWIGWDDLLANLRQVRSLQSDKPRIAVLSAHDNDLYSNHTVKESDLNGSDLMQRIGEVVATGGHPIVDDAVKGIHSRGTAGADDNGSLATVSTARSLINETGEPTTNSGFVSRLTSFCSNFSSLLADLDPDQQSVVLDLHGSPKGSGPAILGSQGDCGSITWAFRGGEHTECTILLSNGLRMPIHFGDSPLAWLVSDLDLNGGGRLDYVNVPPYALIQRSVLILQGPAKTSVHLSINNAPAEFMIPAEKADGGQPLCVEHNGFTLVLCNQQQIDNSIIHDDAFYFGVKRIDSQGNIYAAEGVSRPVSIDAEGNRSKIETIQGKSNRKRALGTWEVFEEDDARLLDHPRSVQVDGNIGLSSTGSSLGYGWFASTISLPNTSKQDIRFLGGLPDAMVWLDGDRIQDVEHGRLALKSTKGTHELSLLARHAPRRMNGLGGSGSGDRPGAMVVVSPLKGVRKAKKSIDPADPYQVRKFVLGAADGQRTRNSGIALTFTHRRKASLFLEIAPGTPGLVILNDEPVAWHDGLGLQLSLVPRETEGFKSGANTIVFAPLENDESDFDASLITLHEVTQELVGERDWRYRRWEQPDERIGSWSEVSKRPRPGQSPRWYRTTIKAGASEGWGKIELEGLSRGRVWLDGTPLGSYESQKTPSRGRKANILSLPVPIYRTEDLGERTLLLFDEGGESPKDVTFRI